MVFVKKHSKKAKRNKSKKAQVTVARKVAKTGMVRHESSMVSDQPKDHRTSDVALDEEEMRICERTANAVRPESPDPSHHTSVCPAFVAWP